MQKNTSRESVITYDSVSLPLRSKDRCSVTDVEEISGRDKRLDRDRLGGHFSQRGGHNSLVEKVRGDNIV